MLLDKSHLLIWMLVLVVTHARPNKNNQLKQLAADSVHDKDHSKVCEPDHLTVYRVILNTFWNEKNFPKHFPQWRPPAQWSKIVGKLHTIYLNGVHVPRVGSVIHSLQEALSKC